MPRAPRSASAAAVAPVAAAQSLGAAGLPDLRRRILDTSRELLEEQGVVGLSLREVARRAGVTHQAPYHHFADRESILAELVTEGFDDLTRRLARANQRAAAGKHATLLASGLAYVGFAMEHPGIFRIMFRPELCDVQRFPALQQAGERAYAELLRLVSLLHDGQVSDSLATTYWAQVHGLAGLMVDSELAHRFPSARARQAHVRQTLEHFADFAVGPRPSA